MLKSSFGSRASYFWTHVGLAMLLNNDVPLEIDEEVDLVCSLREEASAEGLTYLQVLKPLVGTDMYLARVASHPARLAESSLLVFLTEEQLCYTLPFDIRLYGKNSSEVIRAIRAHAATLLPPCPLTETIDIPAPLLVEAVQITALELDACTASASSPRAARSLLQQAYLKAAIDALMHQLWHVPTQVQGMSVRARCKLLAALQRWQRQTRIAMVQGMPHWDEVQGCMIWTLTIILPTLLS